MEDKRIRCCSVRPQRRPSSIVVGKGNCIRARRSNEGARTKPRAGRSKCAQVGEFSWPTCAAAAAAAGELGSFEESSVATCLFAPRRVSSRFGSLISVGNSGGAIVSAPGEEQVSWSQVVRLLARSPSSGGRLARADLFCCSCSASFSLSTLKCCPALS